MGTLAVLDRSGDTKTLWNPDNQAEVDAAKATFTSLRAKGYLAYRVIGDGAKGEQIQAFDPRAGSIILTPPLVGG